MLMLLRRARIWARMVKAMRARHAIVAVLMVVVIVACTLRVRVVMCARDAATVVVPMMLS